MANTDAIDIVRLAPDDAERALPLSVEAGWNQVAADWRFMLEHGSAFGVAEGTRLVASALNLPLGPALSWISMVLVTKEARRRGLGTALLKRCIELGPHVVGLDATEFGRPVYLPLGFHDLYRISRYRLESVPRQVDPPMMVKLARMTEADLPDVILFDTEATLMQRGPTLANLRARMPHVALVARQGTRIVGYVLSREGRLATQIGPVIADQAAANNDQIAMALTWAAMSEATRPSFKEFRPPAPPFFIDALDDHESFTDWLKESGAVAPRYFIRMVRGDTPGLERTTSLFAIAGPELG
jgi:GNAT superfamily N-acetyltransferase